jgi:Asp-tRNA(Asn)/Glu-tRNA(Gln) amidotransferase A subunit family amidase
MSWSGDAVGLVDAYRRHELDPVDVVEQTLAAIAASDLNAFSHVAADEARAMAQSVDLDRPLAGVPFGVKEIEAVAGWPFADASIPLKDRVAERTSTNVARLVAAGAIPVGQTTSSELARAGYTASKLRGITRNPWDISRSPGGSSGGSAAAVAGGLVPFCTSTDGGGSTRQPAAFCGLPGLKVTWRLVPAGPQAIIEPLTVVVTSLTRSVRDIARILDVTVGFDARDPFSLNLTPQFEAGLGHTPTDGLRVAFWPGFGGAPSTGPVVELAHDALTELVKLCGLQLAPAPDVELTPPDKRFAGIAVMRLRRWLGHAWPGCEDDLTPEVAAGMRQAYDLDLDALAGLDDFRNATIDGVAEIFESVDLIVTPTVAYEPFAAEGPGPDTGSDLWPANVSGCPAISLPIGFGPEGLPVGLHIMARHHADDLLLELAHRWERERPWPLTARAS